MFARFDSKMPVEQLVHHIIADGQLAVAEWTSSATTLTGAPYSNDYLALFRVESDLIIEVREYWTLATPIESCSVILRQTLNDEI